MATIAEQLNELQAVKAGLKSALTSGGADMGGAVFTTYPEKVQAVSDRYRALIDGTVSEIDFTGFPVIRDYCCMYCLNLSRALIPDDPELTRLGVGAFRDCHSLKEVNIPDNIGVIGALCFSSCYALTRLVVGTGAGRATTIGSSAFHIGNESHPATLIMRSPVPPLISSSAIGSYVSRIVVPYSGVADYPNATNWAAQAGKFEARLALRWEDGRLVVDYDILDGDTASYFYRAKRQNTSSDDGYCVYYYASEGIIPGEEYPDPAVGGYIVFENNPDAEEVSA